MSKLLLLQSIIVQDDRKIEAKAMSKPLYLMHIGSEYAAKNKLQADVAALVPEMLHNVLTDDPAWIANWVQAVLDRLHAKHNRCKPLKLHRLLEPADMVEFSLIKMRHQNFRVVVGDVCTIYFYQVKAEALHGMAGREYLERGEVERMKGGDDA